MNLCEQFFITKKNAKTYIFTFYFIFPWLKTLEELILCVYVCVHGCVFICIISSPDQTDSSSCLF